MKSASSQWPNANVRTPNETRMRLKTVKTFARTMLAIDRLVVAGSTGPRSSISRAASASERPWSDRLAGGGTRVSVTSATLARPEAAHAADRPVGRPRPAWSGATAPRSPQGRSPRSGRIEA